MGPTKIYQFGARSFFGKIVDTALPINVIGIPFAANISKSDASPSGGRSVTSPKTDCPRKELAPNRTTLDASVNQSKGNIS